MIVHDSGWSFFITYGNAKQGGRVKSWRGRVGKGKRVGSGRGG